MADPRRNPGPGGHPGRGLSTAKQEWVGGRFAAPVHITGEAAPYRPTLLAWIELPDGLVVGTRLSKPTEEHGALGRALTEAMLRPLVGSARRPSSIRVADAELAAEVKTVLPQADPHWQPGPEREIKDHRAAAARGAAEPAPEGAS